MDRGSRQRPIQAGTAGTGATRHASAGQGDGDNGGRAVAAKPDVEWDGNRADDGIQVVAPGGESGAKAGRLQSAAVQAAAQAGRFPGSAGEAGEGTTEAAKKAAHLKAARQ